MTQTDHPTPGAHYRHSLQLPYRPDIDGLRALAVIPVVGFHAFPEWVTGGFIGVDIFFVISGFLISTIILRNLENGQLSFLDFYAGRIKRIFPALIVVLLSCFLFGWLALIPTERLHLALEIIAGAGFISNFMLWGSSGYFAPSIDTMPLMHLWSLSIEEQFYIVWPLATFFLYKIKNHYSKILTLIIIISFSINIYTAYSEPTAAFYSPLSRLWEIAIGGLLAYMQLHTPHMATRKAGWVSSSGIIALVIGMLLIDKEKYFPGWWALLPVGGSLLIISAGPSAWINKNLLSLNVLRFAGLISYPLYLWHWPLLSSARILEETTPSPLVRIVAILIAFVMAWLTWKFIELPLRRQHNKNRIITAALLLLMALMILAGYLMYKQAQSAINQQTDALQFEEHWQGWEKCNNTQNCRIIDATRQPDVTIIGDSHAGHLADGLLDISRTQKLNIVAKQQPMCLPVYSITIKGDTYFDCAGSFINKTLDEAIASPSIHTIILSGYANLHLHKYDKETMENLNLRDLSSTVSIHTNKNQADALRQALTITLETLSASGKKIIFIVDTPELNFEPNECISRRKITLPNHQLKTPCAFEKRHHDTWSSEYHDIVATAERRFTSVIFIHTDEYFCDERLCWAMIDNQLMYSDRTHLSPAGSRYLMQKIKSRILDTE